MQRLHFFFVINSREKNLGNVRQLRKKK